MILVDNSAYSFAYQVSNGVPILPFYDDKSDEEMQHLLYYMSCLADSDDVRELNSEAFGLVQLDVKTDESMSKSRDEEPILAKIMRTI